MTALGCTKVIVTAEEGADLYADANKESEVVGHLDAETEIWVILNEEQTWGQLYSQDEEADVQYIPMEDAEIVVLEEETEEAEETEDEKMAALGYIKVIVTAVAGADLYAEADKESEVVGHLDVETEIWVILNEEQTWGKLYYSGTVEKTEEVTETAETDYAQFICMEDATLKTAEIKDDEKDEDEYLLMPEGAEIDFEIFWDGEALIGETAHFHAIVIGLEEYEYTLQWQSSIAGKSWENIDGANEETMDIVATEEANEFFYRVIAVIHLPIVDDVHREGENEQSFFTEQETVPEQEEVISQQ